MLMEGASRQSAHTRRTIRERSVEFVKLLAGSSAEGFSIAMLQHYATFGVRGNGFGHDAIELACFEGGIPGLFFGIPTGLIAYYVILQSRVAVKQIVVITVGSLIVGCLGGIIFIWFFAFATPVLTIYIAWAVKAPQLYKQSA
jgi:hypothetical protein